MLEGALFAEMSFQVCWVGGWGRVWGRAVCTYATTPILERPAVLQGPAISISRSAEGWRECPMLLDGAMEVEREPRAMLVNAYINA